MAMKAMRTGLKTPSKTHYRLMRYTRMVIYLFAVICLLADSTGALRAAADPLALAREKIAEGDFRKAHRLLEKALRKSPSQAADRLPILAEQADFYENLVGDDRRASKTWQRLLKAAPAGSPAKSCAQQAIARIEDRRHRQADVKQQLSAMRMAAVRPGHGNDPTFSGRMKQQRDQLHHMASHPDLAADIDYTLGLTYLALDQPMRADRSFGRVLADRPAFGFQQPIQRLRNTARQAWIRSLTLRVSWGVLAIFWLTTAIGLAWSRPWRWLCWRHLLAGVLMALMWVVCFQIALHWPGRHATAAEIVNRDGFYPTPTYVHTRPGAPESAVTERLFYHGLAAVGGTYLLIVFTARMRRQGLRHLICTVGGLCLGLALTVQFYYSHCDNLSRLYRRNDSTAGWFSAQLAFRTSEPEPYLLTEPRAYPGVELASISDPLLVDWLERHVPNARRVSNEE